MSFRQKHGRIQLPFLKDGGLVEVGAEVRGNLESGESGSAGEMRHGSGCERGAQFQSYFGIKSDGILWPTGIFKKLFIRL